MPADIPAVFDKIEELRAVSTSQSLHDTTVAAATAQRWLFRHNQTTRGADAPVEPFSERVIDVGGVENWRRQLLSACAHNSFCRAVAWKNERRMALLGASGNVDVVVNVFELLLAHVERLAQAGWRAAREETQSQGVEGRVWRATYCGAAVLTIHNRLVAQRQRDQLSNSASFAFAAAEDARVDAELARRHPRARQVGAPARDASRDPDSAPAETVSVLVDADPPPF